MKNVKVNDTHNFAIVGHSGDGKTSLGEALLHVAGAVPEPGMMALAVPAIMALAAGRRRRRHGA